MFDNFNIFYTIQSSIENLIWNKSTIVSAMSNNITRKEITSINNNMKEVKYFCHAYDYPSTFFWPKFVRWNNPCSLNPHCLDKFDLIFGIFRRMKEWKREKKCRRKRKRDSIDPSSWKGAIDLWNVDCYTVTYRLFISLFFSLFFQ